MQGGGGCAGGLCGVAQAEFVFCQVRVESLRDRFGEACFGWRVVGEFPVGPSLLGCEVVARVRGSRSDAV